MKRLKLLFATVLCVPLLAAGTTYAWNPFASVPCDGKGGSSAVCQDKDETGNPIAGNDGVVMKAINLIALAAGIAAVVIIILGGLQFIQADGNSEKIAAARRTLLYAIVGLVVIILSRAILGLVLSKL